MSFPCGSSGKESACSVGDLGLIPGLGRSPGEGKGYPLQYSGLENSMDRGIWQATVHEVTELETTEQLGLTITAIFRSQLLSSSPSVGAGSAGQLILLVLELPPGISCALYTQPSKLLKSHLYKTSPV